MFTKIKNTIGTLRGFGSCYICGATWNWKSWFTIPTDEYGSGGVIPTCRDCYKNATTNNIIIALLKLEARWIEVDTTKDNIIKNRKRFDYAINCVMEDKNE